jgi:glutamyl-tRNA synthetase
MGYLSEALCNYLLRLGWAHGNDEIISREQAIEWFNLEGIGKSASRFDFTKLENLNGHYIREADDERLLNLIMPLLKKKHAEYNMPLATARLLAAMHGLKQRAKTINELADNATFYILPRPIPINDKAKALLNDDGKGILRALLALYEKTNDWSEQNTQAIAKEYADKSNLKLGVVAQPLRAALSGSNISPSVFEVMSVLGNEESLARIRDVL